MKAEEKRFLKRAAIWWAGCGLLHLGYLAWPHDPFFSMAHSVMELIFYAVILVWVCIIGGGILCSMARGTYQWLEFQRVSIRDPKCKGWSARTWGTYDPDNDDRGKW